MGLSPDAVLLQAWFLSGIIDLWLGAEFDDQSESTNLEFGCGRLLGPPGELAPAVAAQATGHSV